MVNSLSTGTQPVQYERKFSAGKFATSAVAGATLFKVANDSLLRRNANQAIDTLSRTIGHESLSPEITKNAQDVFNTAKGILDNTNYIDKVKSAIKSPIQTLSKAKDCVVNFVKNFSPSKMIEGAKSIASKALEGLKSLKGETFKETISKISSASKTIKGRSITTAIIGAVAGLALFGASKVKKVEQPEQQQQKNVYIA
jgi:phage-related protein